MEAFDVVTVTQGMDGEFPLVTVLTDILIASRRFETKQFAVTPSSAAASTLGCF
jgi:hypothetical protein